MKIIKIKKDNKAIVMSEDHNHTHEIDISLIKKPKIGDYILAHNDMAINKLPLTEAKKILQLVNGKHQHI